MLETNELTRKQRTLSHPQAVLIAYSEEDDGRYVCDNTYFLEVRDKPFNLEELKPLNKMKLKDILK